MSAPILVTGGTGQLGIELARRSSDVVAPGRARLDMAAPASIAGAVAALPWAAVVNCAAYTAVDAAEDDSAAAWQVNALAPAVLAAETARWRIPLIHVSTDYVFDGTKPGAYLPGDPVAPLGVYGASKLGGELAVRSANPHHVIVRTAWVVSAHRGNFVRTMLRLGAERPTIRVVADQHGSPTAAGDLAEALLAVVRAAADRSASGTYHYVNAGEASWRELAEATFAGAAARGGARTAVEPIAASDYPTRACRPARSVLDTADFTARFGVTPRPWQDALDEILDELLPARTGRMRA